MSFRKSIMIWFSSAFKPGFIRRFLGARSSFELLTLVEQAMPIWIMWLFSMALEFRIDLFILFVVVPLVCFVARFPIAINGIGLVEGTYVFYLGLYGVSPEQALALAFASRLGD